MNIRTSPLVQGASEGRRGTPLIVAWIVAFGLGVVVVEIVLGPFFSGLLGYPRAGTPVFQLLWVFTSNGTILVIALWVMLWERRSFLSVGFRSHRWAVLLIGGFLAGMVIFSIPTLFLLLTGQLASGASHGVKTSGWAALPTVLALTPIWLVQSGAEETVMRGYLLQRHALKLPAGLAIGIVSVVFAAAHRISDPIALANTVLFSVFACFLALAQGSLWSAIGVHAGWNMAQGNIFGIPVSGFSLTHSIFTFGPTAGAPDWLTGGDYGIEGSAPATVVLCLVGALAYVYLLRANARRTPGTVAMAAVQ
jgi:CAAX protease family protein